MSKHPNNASTPYLKPDHFNKNNDQYLQKKPKENV